MKVIDPKSGTGLEWPEHIARVAVSGDELWRLDQRSDTMLAVRREDECGTDLGNRQVVLVATRETWRRVAEELSHYFIWDGTGSWKGRAEAAAILAAVKSYYEDETGSDDSEDDDE